MAEGNVSQPFSSNMFVTEVYTAWEDLTLSTLETKYKWINFAKTGYKAIAIAVQCSDLSSIAKFNDSLDAANYFSSGTVVVKNMSSTYTITTTVKILVTYIKI